MAVTPIKVIPLVAGRLHIFYPLFSWSPAPPFEITAEASGRDSMLSLEPAGVFFFIGLAMGSFG